MSELLPTRLAADLRQGLVDYLTTTFALADHDAMSALADFLRDRNDGMFKGPYVRLRLPFQPAADGWQSSLDWDPGLEPYGHQAAAYARLTSNDLGPDKVRPLPTLITTGTGSGKTEAFLHPIIDHVLRARRAGVTGLKALILYPMNALANDQAKRLTELLTTREELAGVTAALYTGQAGPKRTMVSAAGLITDRAIIRDSAPDILLTNYKMLDQLLLRHEDQGLWKQSAHSLQYLVLDEFHTYDGAQGTDVAMLLRRLGIALKSYWPENDDRHSSSDWARPLGQITPVATSATMGDERDPGTMLAFARTVFGDDFDESSVVTESRLHVDEWIGDARARILSKSLTPVDVSPHDLGEINAAVEALGSDVAVRELCAVVLGSLFDGAMSSDITDGTLLDMVKVHPLVRRLVVASEAARDLGDLAAELFGDPKSSGRIADTGEDPREAFLVNLFAALSHLRAVTGRRALTVDLHLWVRELTRINRIAGATTKYLWNDDGEITLGDSDDPFGWEGRPAFPAIYCRHCGRSGWGIGLAAVGSDLDSDDEAIRRNHASREGRFRALLYAPSEADHELGLADGPDPQPIEGLRWFAVKQRTLMTEPPADDDPELRDGWILPVLTLSGADADDQSRDDACPSCQQKDGIRFLGSAIATLLSVCLSTLFGDSQLDSKEKKALVFTDSVQDAAHRAGFIENRSHTLTLRSVLREAVGEAPISLDALVDKVLQLAGEDPFRRYRIIPPDCIGREDFAPYWEIEKAVPARVRTKVRQRLLFDAVLEFGLQAHFRRTLEQTGAVAVEVEAGTAKKLAAIARSVMQGADWQEAIDGGVDALADPQLIGWVRGVLEHMRVRGSVDHDWFRRYITADGNRYWIWRGRPRSKGMPAFPFGRSAPGFPRVGPSLTRNKDPLLDPVASAQSWYARWSARCLGVPAAQGAMLAKMLFVRLAHEDVIQSTTTESGATVYSIPASAITVSPTTTDALASGDHLLVCSVCRNQQPGTRTVVEQLDGAPCLLVRCPGRLRRTARGDNFYRSLYASADMRRIVAREHSSLLDDTTRLDYETGFKQGEIDPNAPNVLVATPTLELGIDIGDLSSVVLASLPRTVASYLQRVGRAGRLTGNSLNLAFVRGRGEQLPRLGDPLSMINGEVRPPATYLSAEEILQRQYVSHLIDGFARDEKRPHPRLAKSAMASADAGTFLGELISFAEEGATAHLGTFLGAFRDLAPSVVDALSQWATPLSGPSTSGLATHLLSASQRWTGTVTELSRRQGAIEKTLPELEVRAAVPAASDDDKRAVRSAYAALRLVRFQLADLRGKYWIQVLEEFGILPNYTLLDDAVTLDVALTWIDPDTQEFKSEPTSYHRSRLNALHELAPGATFYARGLEIEINSVDLGADGESIRTWAFCPTCGFAQDLLPKGKLIAIAQCPRCGGTGIADTKQQFDVVEMTRVSAEVRRDESLINDLREERKRARFVLFVAADIDPQAVTSQWFVKNYDFGAKYLPRLDVRWVNGGLRRGTGVTQAIGGIEQNASLFRVCEACGTLDESTHVNRPSEHRPWCRYRTSVDEHTRTIALTRTLRTQGVVVRLPNSVTVGDPFAVPSLAAALLLGLREQFGGSPDHIAVTQITDPVGPAEGGQATDALLLHDVVPGGTGYLSELASADHVWQVLRRAWEIVSECPCRDEVRLACHRCLLPFANPWQVTSVSRAAAAHHLRAILTGGAADSEQVPPEAMGWPLTTVQTAVVDTESHLEQYFRKVFKERLVRLGATLQEIPTAKGNKVLITIPGGGRRWTLEPQVMVGGSCPDFLLQCSDPNVPGIAIFTDGWLYHASLGHNRIADDSEKRQILRDLGFVVLGITHPDVKQAANGSSDQPPSWFSPDVAGELMRGGFGFTKQTQEAVTGGPIAFLLGWVQDPDVASNRALANALPFFFANGGEHLELDVKAPLIDEARLRMAGDVPAERSQTDSGVACWWWTSGPLGVLSRLTSSGGADVVETLAVLDDRQEALDETDHKGGWQEWLRISNLLNLRLQTTTICALSELIEGSVEYLPAAVGEQALSSLELSFEWQAVWALALPGLEQDFVRALAAEEGVIPPEVGVEVGAGVPADFAWPGQKLLVCFDLSDEDRNEFEAAGWTAVEPVAQEVAEALTSHGGSV